MRKSRKNPCRIHTYIHTVYMPVCMYAFKCVYISCVCSASPSLGAAAVAPTFQGPCQACQQPSHTTISLDFSSPIVVRSQWSSTFSRPPVVLDLQPRVSKRAGDRGSSQQTIRLLESSSASSDLSLFERTSTSLRLFNSRLATEGHEQECERASKFVFVMCVYKNAS